MKDKGKEAGIDRYIWQMREDANIKAEREGFAKHLCEALQSRINLAVNNHVVSTLQIFDAASLVKLHCGMLNGDGTVDYIMEVGEIEEYGVDECKKLLAVVSKMPHMIASAICFDRRMAHTYISKIKKSMAKAIWRGMCPTWFVEISDKKLGNTDQNTKMVEFLEEKSDSLDSVFQMTFEDSSRKKVSLQEQSVYQSFYADKEFYDKVKPPSCALLDIALGKGGPEAIAGSFYNSIRNQQQFGGQRNDTLVRQTKVNWCLPSLKNCDRIIQEGVELYLTGDNNMPSHRKNTSYSSRAASYNVSKVVDRVDSDLGRCPFLI
eukprot:gene1887-2140_t